MFESIIEPVGRWIIETISSLGYSGIVLTMAIESACIPLPSEIIMPFSGYLVFAGRFTLLGVSVAGALGCVVGSVLAYWAGILGGRPFLEKYGKYILLSHRDLDTAERWFDKYGDWAIFFSRLLPVIRTFISLPAGIARMNFPKFILYTFLGSLPWCFVLAYVGKVLGENWESIRTYFRGADIVIIIVIIIGIVFFIYRHLNFKKNTSGV
ncbi:MAG: DedA family protein [candidate division Zixibacteria bacterium]|nr:DedA family protein [candidate division Zixibacteria bacterium]